MQTFQSWSRCVHGQCGGKVSKQEFQDLNLTSNKTQAYTGVGKEAIGLVLDSVYKSFILWTVFPMRLLFRDALSEMKAN